ncbi:hypothetical protein KTD31_00775 [Burkholderia multivorans]|uniref:hypothetical protein n=1 Tax=Burkholderia multivorans TaxID=87883 RepID=UPI001C2259DB|nr:hypothetical protein [Burkholderia multivorans]MBU9199934.1 hypothetical protein [Burkholderia multivorans]MDN8078947.1 hypothetical protein [Burkholderia multivorans]
MCQIQQRPATPDQLSQLRDPAALATLEVLKKNGWLAVDAQALNRFFTPEMSHPAKLALEEEARSGGLLAVVQFAVLLGFAALAILISSFERTLSPMTFVLWGVLGVGAGLLTAKYPGRVFKKRSPDA